MDRERQQTPYPEGQQQPSNPQPQKPDWMSDEDWKEHLEEVRAFNKRTHRHSGGRLGS